MPATKLPLLIEPEMLEANLHNPDILIVDLCQDALFAQKHIPGAVHISPKELMCGTPPAAGKLPKISQLEQIFNRIGLTPDKQVIAYDDEGGGWAGRLIWTLDVIGHNNWGYLNGGFTAWSKEGHPVTNDVLPTTSTLTTINIDTHPIAEIPDILNKLEQGKCIIWDARSPDEYSGKRLLAQRGGHIPGAIHCEWTELMDSSRNLRLRKDALSYLAEKGITPQQQTITHCQSHHRSGFTYLVGKLLGFEDIKGYHGSWSEWGNNPDVPVES